MNIFIISSRNMLWFFIQSTPTKCLSGEIKYMYFFVTITASLAFKERYLPFWDTGLRERKILYYCGVHVLED